MVKSSITPNISQQSLDRFQRHVEGAMAASPHVGRLLNSQSVEAKTADKPQLRRDYLIYSDTLSVLGVGEREYSSQLGQALGFDLVAMSQLYREMCPRCDQGGMIGVTGIIIDAQSGEVLLRVHLADRGNPDDDETVQEIIEELAVDLTRVLVGAFEPKWHKLRFENLRPASSG